MTIRRRQALRRLRSSWVDIAWVIFVGLNLAAMRFLPAWQTVPFLIIWVSLTVIYGFRMWRLQPTIMTLAAVTLATGGVIGVQVLQGQEEGEYLVEVPLIAMMFLLMVSALNRWTQTPRRWSHRLGAEATVLGDRDRLALALDALIENAVAHTDVDGRIELSTRLEGGAVVLGVADSGCGIPAAELDRIFDQFARVDPHRNRKAGGVGLGLAIVKAIAEAHHGSVRAHSTVGEGSLFEVVLPQSTTRRPAPGPRRRQAGTPPAHRESEPTQPATTPSTQP